MSTAPPGDGVIIGLECHVQLNRLNSKLFCSCSTQYQDAAPNTHTCPVCLGLPGALPVINRRAVEGTLKVALALGCEVQEQTLFYRKNYFYPDLPRGYQISQYDFPLAVRGRVLLEEDGRTKEIRITRVHMEEDPGRLTYRGTIDTASHSLVDYNRSGMALMEIVTEPDMRSPREARRFLAKLRNILGYLEVTDGDREGAMRVDANVSIAGGQRVEVKNISSHKGVERALLFEISRQRQMARRGQRIVRETRHYDDTRGITLTLRTKEAEQDYRYFPEPDLVPLRVKGWAGDIRLPELPDAKYERFLVQYGISEHHARVLTGDYKLAALFEEVAKQGVEPRAAATWIADILQGELNYRDEHYRWLLHLAREPRGLDPGLREVRVLPDVGLPFRPDLLGVAPGGPLHVEFELYALDGDGWVEAKRRREALLVRMEGLRSLLVVPGLLEEVPRAEVEAAGYRVVESGPLLGPTRTLAQKTSPAAVGPRTPTVPEYTPERVAPEALVELIGLLARGEITDNTAVAVLREMLDEGGRPGEIVARRGLARAAAGDLGPLLDAVLGENPKAVADVRAGRSNALNYLVGQVLKRTGGKADAAGVRRELEKRIPRP